MHTLLTEKQSLWSHLKQTTKPIYIYGMGDGAQKIIDVLAKLSIPLAGIFASDEFVRGHSFCGYKVLRLGEVQAQTPEFIALLAFAAYREPLLSTIYAMQSKCEFYAPDVPVCKTSDELFDLEFIKAHNEEFSTVYKLLADEQSRRVFINTLDFKISGKIDYLKEIASPISEVYRDIVKPKGSDVYVDLGAYNGDTISEILVQSGGLLAEIVAFEPDKKNFNRMQKRILEENIQNITTYNIGAWSEETVLSFSGKGGRNSKLTQDGKVEVAANSVDNLAPNATIIKFDVEGAELEALMGCKNTIKANAPRLLVSAYHKNEDLFALPLYIHSLNQNYSIYLRHHPYIPSWETNFYCKASN